MHAHTFSDSKYPAYKLSQNIISSSLCNHTAVNSITAYEHICTYNTYRAYPTYKGTIK